MDRRTPVVAALMSALCCLATAAGPLRVPATSTADSLFFRLGGTAKITAFVDASVNELAARPHAGGAFQGQDLQAIKNDLVARICCMSGGGCRQPGVLRTSVASSADAAQSELLEALRLAMRAQDVPLAARNELLELIAPVRLNVASR